MENYQLSTFAVGGKHTADAALMMQLGAEGAPLPVQVFSSQEILLNEQGTQLQSNYQNPQISASNLKT